MLQNQPEKPQPSQLTKWHPKINQNRLWPAVAPIATDCYHPRFCGLADTGIPQRTESTSCNVAKAWLCDDATGFDREFEDGFWSCGFCCYRIVAKENGFLFLFFHFSNYQSLCGICGFIFKIKTASFQELVGVWLRESISAHGNHHITEKWKLHKSGNYWYYIWKCHRSSTSASKCQLPKCIGETRGNYKKKGGRGEDMALGFHITMRFLTITGKTLIKNCKLCDSLSWQFSPIPKVHKFGMYNIYDTLNRPGN